MSSSQSIMTSNHAKWGQTGISESDCWTLNLKISIPTIPCPTQALGFIHPFQWPAHLDFLFHPTHLEGSIAWVTVAGLRHEGAGSEGLVGKVAFDAEAALHHLAVVGCTAFARRALTEGGIASVNTHAAGETVDGVVLDRTRRYELDSRVRLEGSNVSCMHVGCRRFVSRGWDENN